MIYKFFRVANRNIHPWLLDKLRKSASALECAVWRESPFCDNTYLILAEVLSRAQTAYALCESEEM
jgi:hypothetical protein